MCACTYKVMPYNVGVGQRIWSSLKCVVVPSTLVSTVRGGAVHSIIVDGSS